MLPRVQVRDDRLAPVGGEAPRAARNGPEDRLGRLRHLEGDVVADRLHLRQPVLTRVQHVGVARHRADLRVREPLYEDPHRVRLYHRVGVDKGDDLRLRRSPHAGRHRGSLPAVLREVDHLDARLVVGNRPDPLERCVRRAVVDDDYLELVLRIVECQDGPDRVRDGGLLVESRRDDSDRRLDSRVPRGPIDDAEQKPADDVRADHEPVHGEVRVDPDHLDERDLVDDDRDQQRDEVDERHRPCAVARQHLDHEAATAALGPVGAIEHALAAGKPRAVVPRVQRDHDHQVVARCTGAWLRQERELLVEPDRTYERVVVGHVGARTRPAGA